MSEEEVSRDDSKPRWTWYPFGRFITYLRESDRLLRLSIVGFQMITTSPALHEALTNLRIKVEERSITQDEQEELDRVREDAAFAKTEAERHFSRLVAHANVDLWSALEVLVEDVALTWLGNFPRARESDILQRIKVPFVEYETADDQDARMRLVLRELQRATEQRPSEQRLGVGQFEEVLNMVGLGGSVAENTRRGILELQQIRNVIVHRASVVDERLVRLCPWLALSVGDTLQLGYEKYNEYREAASDYGLTLLNRRSVLRGLPPYDVDSEHTAAKLDDERSAPPEQGTRGG